MFKKNVLKYYFFIIKPVQIIGCSKKVKIIEIKTYLKDKNYFIINSC